MRAVGLCAVLALAGCAVGPDFKRPDAPSEHGYTAAPLTTTTAADGKAQRFNEGAVDAEWWKLFGSPALSEVVRGALANNPGLDAARATLRRNQESLRAGYGVFFPQVDGRLGASRQLYNPAPGTLPSKTFNLFTLAGTVSYTVDVWGGERREVEALRAGVDAQRYALEAAQVMLTSNVVVTVIAEAAYRDEIADTRTALGFVREQARIANAQATAGTMPYANVLTLESQIASTEALVPALEQRIDEADDLLAALSGRTAAAMPLPARPKLADLRLPEDLPLSVPSQLVRQRPDVLIAEAELHAANAEIGVATAAMLPNVTLSAAAGVNNTTVGGLFGPGSAAWNLGAGLTTPLFHGGTLNAQRRAAIEARNATAADYRQTVLGSFEQVTDTLRALTHDADAVAAEVRAVDAAEGALRIVQANYEAGIGTYLQVLIADTQYLQAKLGYTQAAAQRLQDTVALFAALGGGWR